MLNQCLQQGATLCRTFISHQHRLLLLPYPFSLFTPSHHPLRSPFVCLATFINFNKPKLLTWLCSSHSVLQLIAPQSFVISHIRVYFFWPSLPNCVTTISLSALSPFRHASPAHPSAVSMLLARIVEYFCANPCDCNE